MNSNTKIEFVDSYEDNGKQILVLNIYNGAKICRIEIANADLDLLSLIDEFEASEIDGDRIFPMGVFKKP